MPKVYDKEGRELTVGARVRDTLVRRPDGEVVAVGWIPKSGWGVKVRFPGDTRPNAWLAYAHEVKDTWRTPGLLLIDSSTEGKEG